ncbi:MAG: cytochrome c3 family protein [Bacteroidota bacterium]
MTSKRLTFKLLIFATFALFSTSLIAQDTPDGKALFKANCAQCHNKNMKDNLTGPALGGTQERWAEYPQEELYAWIRNSQKMIADGHPRAKELWADWSPTVMTAFPNLTDADIDEILLYIEGIYTGDPANKYAPKIAVTGGGGALQEEEKANNTPILILLFVALALFALVLSRIQGNLNQMAAIQAGEEAPARKTLVETLTSRGLVTFVIFAVVVLGGYTTVNNAISMGRQQGYAPQQPIKFSHATHAGLNKIDCQYCHDAARRSKHASIPGVNTCMNCHSAIKNGSSYGTAELTKIYASAGWDPNTGKYLEGYQDLPVDSVTNLFRKWIKDSYEASDEGSSVTPEKVDKFVDDQLAGVTPFIQKPIEWVRIHNLPDHAYFNHAQHVTVGEVECQTCHGEVEEMEVLQQYAPLSMGWCINCHRQTEVQFEGNDYYIESYEQYHKDLKEGKIDKVVVEDIGGLECQKCHY